MNSSTTSLTEARAAMASGDRPIGALVYWRKLTDVHMERGAFKTGFRNAGCGKALAKDPKPEALLNQAANAAARRQGREERAKIKLKGKSTEVAVYAVLMRRDIGDLVRYVEEARVGVRRDGGNGKLIIEVEQNAPQDEARDALLANVEAIYTDLRDYVHGDEMSQTLMRAIAFLGGVSLRTGCYFLHALSLPSIELLQKFITENSTAHLACWDVKASDGDRNAKEARTEVRASMTARLEEIIAEVTTFTASIVTAEDVLPKSINARVGRFRELDGEVSLFADILGDYQEELHRSIAEAKQKLLGAYLGQQDDSLTADSSTNGVANDGVAA